MILLVGEGLMLRIDKNIIDINLIRLRKLLTDENYRQKEEMKRKQYLYDYDYKKFLEGVIDHESKR